MVHFARTINGTWFIEWFIALCTHITHWAAQLITSHLPVIPTVQTHPYTSRHSSRMHTARLLPVSPSMHCAGGGVSAPGGVCSQDEVVYSSMQWGRPPSYGQNSWHTLLKILPCPNCVVGGNKKAFQSNANRPLGQYALHNEQVWKCPRGVVGVSVQWGPSLNISRAGAMC